MARPDGFDEYAAARWPDLVRTALLLGAPEPVAVDVATEALARLRGQWRELQATGDPDAELRELVVETWDAVRRSTSAPSSTDDAPAGLTELDAMTPADRARTVLEHLDPTATTVDPRWAAVRELLVTAPVPGRADLGAATHRRRVRQARRAAVPVAALVLLLAVGGGLAVLLRDDPPPPAGLPRALTSVEVGRGPSSSVTWWADGRLHLGATTVAVPSLRAVVDVLGAAVYVGASGEVVRVAPDGRRVLLGSTDDPGTVVVAAGGDLVGWVDVTRPSAPALVVADAADGARRATYPLAERGDVRPVGLREDRMYVVDADRTRVFRFGRTGTGERDRHGIVEPELERTDLPRLEQVLGQLAVVGPASPTGRARLAFLDPQDRTPPESTWVRLPGEQVRVAATGRLVASRSATGEVALVVQGVSGLLPSGLDADEVALDVGVAPDGRVGYLVVRAGDRPTSRDLERSGYDGPLTLLTCTVSAARHATECDRAVDLTGVAELPVLAR